jgi:predicted nucleic acid-binding protein
MAMTRRRYWDSDCFIGWLAAEPDKVDDCRTVIRAAERGELVIVTSSLSIAEVVKLRHRKPIPPADADQVRKFFRQPYIVIRELDRFLGEEAQSMVWNHGVDPKDAVHVATALRVGVEQLDTFDEHLIGKSGAIGNPPLLIGRPLVTEQLELPKPDAPPDAGDDRDQHPSTADATPILADD